jgi:hypothetical protein
MPNMTEPALLLSLIRQVRAQRHAPDALEGERLRLEGSFVELRVLIAFPLRGKTGPSDLRRRRPSLMR